MFPAGHCPPQWCLPRHIVISWELELLRLQASRKLELLMLMEQEEIPDTREEVGGHHSHSNTRAAGRERERGGRLRLCLLLAGHQQHWGRLQHGPGWGWGHQHWPWTLTFPTIAANSFREWNLSFIKHVFSICMKSINKVVSETWTLIVNLFLR